MTEEELPIYDSLSNLGLEGSTEETETMTVDPLKELTDIEFEILALHLRLIAQMQKLVNGNEQATDAPLLVKRLSDLRVSSEKQLWSRMAKKFGFNNIDQLLATNLRFRLRSGHFLEAYNE